MKDDQSSFLVKKINNVSRNYERLKALDGYLNVPKIFKYDGVELTMEYIHGQDMKTYLMLNNPTNLINSLVDMFDKFLLDGYEKDYTDTYAKFLGFLDSPINPFPFSKDELISRLPKKLFKSMLYHGDLTLENIIFSKNKFYFIDAVTTPFDSCVFDLAKMRQDVECKWFLRHDNIMLDGKLSYIKNELTGHDKLAKLFNDELLILMLLRVYLHCTPNSIEQSFVMKEVNRLWK